MFYLCDGPPAAAAPQVGLWQSCIRVFNIEANRFAILAKTGAKEQKTFIPFPDSPVRACEFKPMG
jgi:hypothetical protein